MTDEFLVTIADAVLKHVDEVERNGRTSHPIVVFNYEGRQRAHADRKFYEFFEPRITEVEDLSFMGYPTKVDTEQTALFTVRETE
jgi:predicted deacetylase